MAKLYFSYSAMNAGKSTILLQASHNYFERGMKTMLITSNLDNRVKKGKITSRIGLSEDAELFDKYTNIYSLIDKFNFKNKISCVLIDEAQFLSHDQVWQLSDVVDKLKLPVMCYGLRTDFLGKLFSGSEILLSIADEIREIRTICHCGKKATMTVRLNEEGKPLQAGQQIQIGGNESYVSMCRTHFKSNLGLLKD